MRPKRFRLLLATLAIAGSLLSVAPAGADTVTPKPRLALVVTGGSGQFLATLRKKLLESRRFELVERPDLTRTLAQSRISLADGISVQQSREARKETDTDMVLDASVQQQAGTVRISTRLFDFRSGEYSRDLSLLGSPQDADMLAGQLATFVRHAVPIRCLIKDMAEDQVILDLGSMDGVQVGTFYQVYRYPQNMRPVEIGLVRVSAVEPFAAVGEVEESAKGVTFQKGDALVERTSGFLVSLP